jgi:hypothetical protein
LARLAVALLLLDAALLAIAGRAVARPALVVLATLLLGAAALVLLLARRQRAKWEEVDAARRAVRDEVRVLAELVRRIRGAPPP